MSDDIHAICRRALGFLELGMPEDAIAELDEITVESSIALHLRVDALFRLEEWQAAAGVCEPMTRREPSDPGWWIQFAYAVRRARSLEEAEGVLREALGHHPQHGLILYNLSCYACIRGDRDEAVGLLSRAIAGNPEEMLKMAVRDPDLEGIRPWILGQPGTPGTSPTVS